jgi:hypothetical protein
MKYIGRDRRCFFSLSPHLLHPPPTPATMGEQLPDTQREERSRER